MVEQPDFNPSLCEVSPTGMLALNQANEICWLNPAFEGMLELSAGELLGKGKDALPQDLWALFDDTDMLHLSLGEGGERWLQREVRDVTDAKDKPFRVYFFQDISAQVQAVQEQETLRQEVESLTITDELTGLANQRALVQAVETQVTRTRRYGNPLVLAAICVCNALDMEQQLSDKVILAASRFLRDRLRWADTIGRYEHQKFLIVMPETQVEDSLQLLSGIQQEMLVMPIEGLGEEDRPVLKYSASAWERGDDAQKFIQRVLQGVD